MLKERFLCAVLKRDTASSLMLPLIVISGINFFRIGFQLVLAAWFAVSITGKTGAVGQIFIASCIANLLASPLIGRWVDFFENKKALILLGHSGIALPGALPFLCGVFFPLTTNFVFLVIAIIVNAVFNLIASGAMDYFMKIHLSQSQKTQKLALLNSVTQVTLILGTGLGGIVLTVMSFYQAFFAISFFSIVIIFLCISFLPNLIVARNTENLHIKEGGKPFAFLYLHYPYLFVFASCAALVFSVAQATNALLPALINIYFKKTSLHYSMIEAAWSIGAFCVSVFLVKKVRRKSSSVTHDLWLIVGMASLLALVPYFKYFVSLLIVHCLLGVSFAYIRIHSETRFLTFCPTQLLGRLRASSVVIANIIGLAIFAIPTLFKKLSIPSLYLLMAFIISLSVFLLLALMNMNFYKDYITIEDKIVQ